MIIKPVGYNGPNMKPMIQNPTESAMMEGMSQTSPAATPAAMELRVSSVSSASEGRGVLDQPRETIACSLGNWDHDDPADRHACESISIRQSRLTDPETHGRVAGTDRCSAIMDEERCLVVSPCILYQRTWTYQVPTNARLGSSLAGQ
jgi:hypothetical protein